MQSEMPCAATIALNNHFDSEERAEEEDRIVQRMLDDLVDEEIVLHDSRHTLAALAQCEEEWYLFAEMEHINIDTAPVYKVVMLARYAQELKLKLMEALRCELESKARSQYRDGY